MPERRRGYHRATLTVRQLATGLASNRILFGLGFVLVPARRQGVGSARRQAARAHLASDATDFAATWAARRDLGRGRSAYALFMAGASTAIAAAYLARSGSDPAANPLDQG